jgi:hypothetical protein
MRALRRVLPLILALTLATGILAVNPGAVGAWNGMTYVEGGYACGPGQWCILNYYVGGGVDSADYIRIDFVKYCNGSAVHSYWEGTKGRGWHQFWNFMGAGCHSSYAAIYWYDYISPQNAWIGPYA